MRKHVASIATVCATAVVGALLLAGASASPAPPVADLGFYPGYGDPSQLQSLESWLGQNVSYIVQFGDTNDDSKFTSSIWGQVIAPGALETIANRLTLVESVPLAFGSQLDASTAAGQAQARANLQATVNGAHDTAYSIAANYLKTGGFPNAIIRLGWEFDGTWMPWSAPGNEALFASAFRHVVGIFRGVSSSFRFDWNGDRGYLQNETAAYPGDAYVDDIGVDLYDKGMGVAWSSSTHSWVDPAAAWNTNIASLQFQRDFAISHGKQVSFPEWGLATGGTEAPTNAGGDDPTFIQGMYDWMNGLPSSGPGSLAYHGYFNVDTSNDGYHALSHFPNASARFLSLFGPNSSSSQTQAPAPTTTAAPPTTVAPRTTTTVPPTTTTQPPPPAAPASTAGGSAAQAPSAANDTGPSPSQGPDDVLLATQAATNLPSESSWAGASESTYVAGWGAQGQYVTFTFPAGGSTSLVLRYSAGNGVASRKIELDGSVWQANQSFPATSSWSAWNTLALNVSLPAGQHTLKLSFDSTAGSRQYINLDDLTVAPSLVIQAESASTNLPTEKMWSGSVGTTYLAGWGSQGQYVTFAFNANGGPTRLSLRYSAGNGPASRKVELDGSVWQANQVFPATPNWNTWTTLTLPVSLTPGPHTLKISFDRGAGSNQYINLDNLTVT